LAPFFAWLLIVTIGNSPARAAELVMFESEYCSWCETWHSEIGPVYPKTAEARIAPLRRVDIDDERPADLVGLKAVMFTPTFVLMHEGREIGRIQGYPGEDFFWPLLGELIRKLPRTDDHEQLSSNGRAAQTIVCDAVAQPGQNQGGRLSC
jgi:thioredoxin-related protein